VFLNSLSFYSWSEKLAFLDLFLHTHQEINFMPLLLWQDYATPHQATPTQSVFWIFFTIQLAFSNQIKEALGSLFIISIAFILSKSPGEGRFERFPSNLNNTSKYQQLQRKLLSAHGKIYGSKKYSEALELSRSQDFKLASSSTAK